MMRKLPNRSMLHTSQSISHIPGNNPTQTEQNSEIDFCTLLTPEEERKQEIDKLLVEYNQHKARINQIQNRLNQLGFHT
jgi:hypothetical protein